MVDTLYMCVLSIDVTMHNNAYIYNMYICVCVSAIYVYLTGIINQQTL
jgi:hypothetical protein